MARRRAAKKDEAKSVTLTAKEVKSLKSLKEDMDNIIEDLQDMRNELEDLLGIDPDDSSDED
jgi:pantothenate kinase